MMDYIAPIAIFLYFFKRIVDNYEKHNNNFPEIVLSIFFTIIFFTAVSIGTELKVISFYASAPLGVIFANVWIIIKNLKKKTVN